MIEHIFEKGNVFLNKTSSLISYAILMVVKFHLLIKL